MSLANSLIALFGISGAAAMVAAFYYGKRLGKAEQSDIDSAKIVRKQREINQEMLQEVTAKDASDAATRGEF